MKRKGFTLVEIMIAIIIIGIIATLGIPAYRNSIEDSKSKACEANLKALQATLDIYIMERQTVPGTWGMIPAEYFKRGYARVMNGKDAWKIKLAYFVLGMGNHRYLYALAAGEPLLRDITKGNNNILLCPADTRTIPNKVSYAINANLQNKTAQEYKALASNEPVIVDYDATLTNYEFNSAAVGLFAFRHKNFSITGSAEDAIGINNQGQIIKRRKTGGSYNPPGTGGGHNDTVCSQCDHYWWPFSWACRQLYNCN